MSWALNEASDMPLSRSLTSWCSQPGGRDEPGTKVIEVAGALEAGTQSSVNSHGVAPAVGRGILSKQDRAGATTALMSE